MVIFVPGTTCLQMYAITPARVSPNLAYHGGCFLTRPTSVPGKLSCLMDISTGYFPSLNSCRNSDVGMKLFIFKFYKISQLSCEQLRGLKHNPVKPQVLVGTILPCVLLCIHK